MNHWFPIPFFISKYGKIIIKKYDSEQNNSKNTRRRLNQYWEFGYRRSQTETCVKCGVDIFWYDQSYVLLWNCSREVSSSSENNGFMNETSHKFSRIVFMVIRLLWYWKCLFFNLSSNPINLKSLQSILGKKEFNFCDYFTIL